MSDRARFAEVVRAEPLDLGLACALVAAEVVPDLDVDAVTARLDALAADVPAGDDDVARLRAVLGGFAGTGADYDDVRSSLLPEVLARRRGLPLLLAVVWVEVARRAGIAAEAVGLPGHVVVRVGARHVDAFAGGAELDGDALAALVRAATGGPLRAEHLEATPAADLLLRLLTNVRVLASRQDASLEAVRTRLWAVELSLLLPRHPYALRRERGELRVRLGDHLGGAAELEEWAGVAEGADPAAAEQARRAARSARARLN